MGDEDRWAKLESIIRRVVGEELDVRGLKSKTKIGFVNGKWIGVTDDQLSVWRSAYGSVDINAELMKAAAWIVSNPMKAPKREIGRFLNAWFSREQDRLSIRSIPTRSETLKNKICAYCDRPSNGQMVSGIYHCPEHWREAMDGKPARAA